MPLEGDMARYPRLLIAAATQKRCRPSAGPKLDRYASHPKGFTLFVEVVVLVVYFMRIARSRRLLAIALV
jgi:hypothetical protein